MFTASLGLFCNGAFVGWSSQASGMLPETVRFIINIWQDRHYNIGSAAMLTV